jgi:hypothetical protein
MTSWAAALPCRAKWKGKGKKKRKQRAEEDDLYALLGLQHEVQRVGA